MPQEDPMQPKNKEVGVRDQWWDFSGWANYPDSSQGVPPTADEALRSQVDGMTWDGRKGFLRGCPWFFSPWSVPAHTEHIHVAVVFPLGEIHVLEMDLPSLAILLLPAPALWTPQVLHLLPWCTITRET